MMMKNVTSIRTSHLQLYFLCLSQFEMWRENSNSIVEKLNTEIIILQFLNQARKFKLDYCPFKTHVFVSTSLKFGAKIKRIFLFSVLNVAAGKAPMQSSVLDRGIPQKAVDGSTSTFYDPSTCTLTEVERAPWWYVNLLEPYMVQLVRVDFGQSCCCKSIFCANDIYRFHANFNFQENRSQVDRNCSKTCQNNRCDQN